MSQLRFEPGTLESFDHYKPLCPTSGISTPTLKRSAENITSHTWYPSHTFITSNQYFKGEQQWSHRQHCLPSLCSLWWQKRFQSHCVRIISCFSWVENIQLVDAWWDAHAVWCSLSFRWWNSIWYQGPISQNPRSTKIIVRTLIRCIVERAKCIIDKKEFSSSQWSPVAAHAAFQHQCQNNANTNEYLFCK